MIFKLHIVFKSLHSEDCLKYKATFPTAIIVSLSQNTL